MRIPAFHTCGYLGLASGFAVTLLVAAERQLSLLVIASLLLTAVLTFLVLAMATKIAVGGERLVYYHHEIVILGANAALLKLIHSPVLAYLDVAVLGLGVFLAFGRVGCWMSGCCHGRPHRWGLLHRREAGLPPYGAGVRLVPVQLLESVWVFAAVVSAIPVALRSTQPGEVLAWYTFVYGAGRFALEFLRGDPGRPYWKGASEAQWTSWLLMGAAAGAELAGALPQHAWHIWLAALVTSVMAVLVVTESETRALFRPAHLCQLSEALETVCALASDTGRLHLGTTSLGLQVSASTLRQENRPAEVIAFSMPGRALPAGAAARLGRAIAQLRGCGPAELQSGIRNVYHLILSSPRSSHAL